MLERLELFAQSLSWIAAWLILPAWLAYRGAGFGAFGTYALGAGLILGLGVFLDRPSGFSDVGHIIWFATVSCLAVLTAGGLVFALVTLAR